MNLWFPDIILLPKEALGKLKAGKGDTLYLVENKEGYTLTPYQEDFQSQMEAAEKVLKKYRNALHELATTCCWQSV